MPYVLEWLAGRGLGWRVAQVHPSGALVPFPVPPGGVRVPGGATLSTSGSPGLAIYISEGRLLRITPDGTAITVATGLGGINSIACARGTPFGPAIFVADGMSRTIYRLTPAGP